MNKKVLNESLIEAAKSGDLEQVRALVEKGADPNFGEIPSFSWAYFKGHTDISKWLLNQGGNVNHDEFTEMTLLMAATVRGDVEFVEFLIDSGADVNLSLPAGGETALHKAAIQNQPETMKLLIQRGGDVNRRTKIGGKTEMDFFGTVWGETPLHIAAVAADKEVITLLIEAGADKTLKTSKGATPLGYAQHHERPEEIIQLLRFEEKALGEKSYIDAKGRTRWHENDEIALKFLELHTFLIIADYPEDHASRYPWLANYISRFPEPVSDLIAQGRLIEEIPGAGEVVENIVKEFLDTGTSAKLEEFAGDTPRTVVELVPIPGLGAKTIKRLYEEVGVDSLVSLRAAIDEGRLKGFKGIGKKTLEKIEAYLDEVL